MKIKTFILAAVMALGTCAINAHASLWTVTSQGTIDYGYDNLGLFGTAGQDLTGLTFTQSITATTDPAQWSYSYNGGTYAYMYGSGPSFTDTVTVNGNSVTFNVDSASWGEQYLSNELSQYGYWYDEVYSYQQGSASNGLYVYAENDAWTNTAPFVPSLDFVQDLFTNQGNFYSYFSAYGELGETYFQSYNQAGSSLSVNGGSNVPEPGSLALLGLGLAGLVALRRKQG